MRKTKCEILKCMHSSFKIDEKIILQVSVILLKIEKYFLKLAQEKLPQLQLDSFLESGFLCYIPLSCKENKL